MSFPGPLAKRLGAELLVADAPIAAGCGAIAVETATIALGQLGEALSVDLSSR